MRGFGGDIKLRPGVLGNKFVSLTGDGTVEKSSSEAMEQIMGSVDEGEGLGKRPNVKLANVS